MPLSRCSSTNAVTASTFPTTGWPVFWLPIRIPRHSRSRGISTRKSRPFCQKWQAESTSLRLRSGIGKLRRSDDQSIAVGSFRQCPDSGGHKRPSAGCERNEMVTHFLNAYFGQARCRAGGHGDYRRSKPETCRLDRAQRQEFDGHLRDPRPRLNTIESLKPVAAIAGHKRPGAPDTPDNIEATRKYIRDFDRIASHTNTALDLYHEMLAIYPQRVNPAVLWYSAQAVKPGN